MKRGKVYSEKEGIEIRYMLQGMRAILFSRRLLQCGMGVRLSEDDIRTLKTGSEKEKTELIEEIHKDAIEYISNIKC